MVLGKALSIISCIIYHFSDGAFASRRIRPNIGILGVSNGKCETLRDGETDTFSASPRLS